MMDEFENNRENEHVDQTPHAETPYDTGDGNTDNLKRTEQQTEQNAEHRQEDAYTQAQQYGSTYYGDMRTQEYMQAMAERAQQMSQGTEHYYNNNYQQPNQNAYNYGQNNYYQNGFQNADAEQPKAKVKKAKKQRVKKAKSPKTHITSVPLEEGRGSCCKCSRIWWCCRWCILRNRGKPDQEA